MSTVPTPSDMEKNACPRAQAHPDASSLEKSGRTMYSTPADAPGSESEYTTMASIRKNKIGMVILVNFSMPFLMPPSTIKAVIKKKPIKASIDSGGEAAIRENTPTASSGRPGASPPQSERSKKSSDHPPTTQ